MSIKNNKLRFLLCLLVLVATFNITNAQIKVGVKTGVDFSNVIMKNENGDKAATQSTPGIFLGVTVDIPIIGDLYIEPAAQYSRKGFKQQTGAFFGSATNFQVNVSYIQVPLNILYKPRLGAGNLLFGAGPYIGYGTGGKWTSDTDILIGDITMGKKGDAVFKKDASDGEFGTYLYGKPLDYGANFLAGYEFFHKLSVQFNAQVGLANLQPEYDGVKREGKLKNTDFGISLGYIF
jgi:hypothetical protein